MPMTANAPSPDTLDLRGDIPLADGGSLPVSVEMSAARIGPADVPASFLEVPASIGEVAKSVRLVAAADPFPTPALLPSLSVVD